MSRMLVAWADKVTKRIRNLPIAEFVFGYLPSWIKARFPSSAFFGLGIGAVSGTTLRWDQADSRPITMAMIEEGFEAAFRSGR